MSPAKKAVPPPLTDAEKEQARALVTAWYDEQVTNAQNALTKAREDLTKAHDRRAAWLAGEPPTWTEATPWLAANLIEAWAGGRFVEEAQKVLAGTGSRQRAEVLLAESALVTRFLRDEYGHDTSGEGGRR